MAEQAAGLAALALDGDRREGRRDLLAGRGERVHLARVGNGSELVGELEQAVGLAAHRADDDHDFVAEFLRFDGACGDVADALERADRGATEFLDDECHGSCAEG